MIAFFIVIIVIAVILAVFALMPSKGDGGNEKKQGNENLNNHFVRRELTLKMEEQINSLNVELEKLKAEHEQVRAELTLANELVSNLKDELDKTRKSAQTAEQEELEKLKNDNARFRDELYKKGKELEKSLSDNLSLSKDVSKGQGAEAKLELLEKQITEHNNKITEYNNKIAEYNNKIEEYKAVINKLEETIKETVPKQEYHQVNNKCLQLSAEFEALKNKSIPKEEYEALTRKISETESKIGRFNNENQDLINKIKILESEINEHNKEILRQKELIFEHEQAKERALKKEKELEIFKQDKSDLENKIKMLELQINKYSEEIEKQTAIISQRQSHEEQANEAFKKEYDSLKSKLEDSASQMKELEKLNKENIDLLGQVKSLEKQIENYHKQLKKDKAAGGVSKEQYEELKNKLEKAEEVLRMLHGAGA